MPFYAFQALGLEDGEKALSTIESMAEYYIKILLNTYTPQQPIILGGWSSGGIVAYEMAKQLKAKNIPIANIIMIDSPAPIERDRVDEETLTSWFITDITTNQPTIDQHDDLATISAAEKLHNIITDIASAQPDDPQETIDRLYRALNVFRANIHAIRCYQPDTIDVPITLYRANGETINEFLTHPALHKDDWGWQPFTTCELETIQLEADHYSIMTDSHIQMIAQQLKEKIKQLANQNITIMAD